MSHYKSNLRDIEFNLFEVLGRDRVLGTGPFEEIDADTARSILAEVDRLAREELAASYQDSDRTRPVFDPATGAADVPEAFAKSYHAWMDAEYWRLALPAELGGQPAPATLNWALGELVLGANAPVWMYACGPAFAAIMHRNGNDRDKRIAEHMVDRQVGRHHGAHRAGRRLRRRRRPHPGGPAGRRLLAHRGRQAVHHLRRAPDEREHRPPGAGPAGRRRGRRRPGHQGPVAVHRAQVALRPRHRRADRRAQRRARHRASRRRWASRCPTPAR